MTVVNSKTGEEIVSKKFYKADFNSVWMDPKHRQYIDALLDNALIRKLSNDDDIDIDVDSYSEVAALAEDLDFQDDLSI